VFVTLSRMVSPDEPQLRPDSGNGAEARAQALEVVQDALQWRLAAERWRAMEQVLITLEAALRAGDSGAVAAATADLELAGPLRVTRIGATPMVPALPPVRDRLNRLVHTLGGRTAAQQQENDDTGTGEGGISRS
jgi:hypothetical protein